MALIVSARTRSEATRDRSAGPGPIYDEYREVLEEMAEETNVTATTDDGEEQAPEMVLVQGPDHEEGQGFKMTREKAEQYVKDNPEASIQGSVESPPPPGEPDQAAEPAQKPSGGEPEGGSKPAPQPASSPSKPAASADKG